MSLFFFYRVYSTMLASLSFSADDGLTGMTRLVPGHNFQLSFLVNYFSRERLREREENAKATNFNISNESRDQVEGGKNFETSSATERCNLNPISLDRVRWGAILVSQSNKKKQLLHHLFILKKNIKINAGRWVSSFTREAEIEFDETNESFPTKNEHRASLVLLISNG